ncbi:ABC transporter ATP-binding protein [Paenibacillus sp. IB182493]|uniref:ABC transporter ATP-binding protein n=1 Tax=Paenibacillus arenilitoris TaxID=2772299 RepID=A0A927CFC6_9BACL|nr:ABC transporter ATP-binding protein [Paenibacillus arenilitoris]
MMELQDINKLYPGVEPLHILKNIQLTVRHGEFLAIVGQSGSGKSTLMNVMGLLDIATTGAYRFEGVDVSGLTDEKISKLRSRKIGFVFQQFNLLPRLSALENVEIPMIYAGIGRKERREKAMQLLEQLGLAERAKHRPSKLSGGQQQRVAIARALANSPTLILADEPTGALDTTTGLEVLHTLVQLNEQGNTIILITHDLTVASYAQRLITLKDGVIISDERLQTIHKPQKL